MEATQTAAMRLRSAGLRATAIRIAVLDVLQTMPHASVQDIAEGVQQVLGTASLQAVYYALDLLLLTHLVRRIEPAGSPARSVCAPASVGLKSRITQRASASL